MIRFSVVIPYYERYDYIVDAIDSILTQTYPYWELIIVNDGSDEDMIKPIIDSYHDGRIKYFYKEHSGIADTRNFGNSKASFDWIVVQDADDLSSPYRLEIYKNFIREHSKTDWIYGSIKLVSVHNNYATETWMSEPLTYEKLIEGTQCVMHGSSCYRKTTKPYRKECKVNDDFWKVWDDFFSGCKFDAVAEVIYSYRVLEDGTSRRNYQKIKDDTRKKIKKELKNIDVKKFRTDS